MKTVKTVADLKAAIAELPDDTIVTVDDDLANPPAEVTPVLCYWDRVEGDVGSLSIAAPASPE
jgi:hypothetical protein